MQSAFPQSHTQQKSLSYMLQLELCYSEFLETTGLFPSKTVGDKEQTPH